MKDSSAPLWMARVEMPLYLETIPWHICRRRRRHLGLVATTIAEMAVVRMMVVMVVVLVVWELDVAQRQSRGPNSTTGNSYVAS
jgi:hypothetical protein